MAIRHSITLSTSEPNNEVGNLKIRQGDEQTQTLIANITENGVPKPFTGLQPFFCAKIGQTAGLGIIEQKVTGPMNPANGTLEYVMQPEDWQQLGRQTAYFSFRKMVNDHEWTEQFSTRDFNYNVTKSAFSEGVKETKKDGSTYIWTIEDMLRLFKEYIATGKIEWENYKNDERTIWETYRLAEKINWDDYKLREKNEWKNYKDDEKITWEKFVEDNREFLENADPGGEIILELLGARGGATTLGERLDESDAQLEQTEKQFNSDENEETASLGNELIDGTGWISGTGWSGDFASGFTHTVGNTALLKKTLSSLGFKFYQVEITVNSPSSTMASNSGWTVSIGGSTPFEMYEGNFTDRTYIRGIQALNGVDLVITPQTGFDGTITNVSVKEITGTIQPTTVVKDSLGQVSYEVKPTRSENENVFIGKNNAMYNTTGKQSVGVGANALSNNTTGFWNVAVGKDALMSNTVGSRNVALGYIALKSNISGHRNIAIGPFNMHDNTHGHNNIALGADTLQRNTIGNYNVAIGLNVLANNLEGSDSIGIGYNALGSNTVSGLIGIGRDAASRNVTGTENIAVGMNALKHNKTGGRNLVIGHQSLNNVNAEEVTRNLVIGSSSGQSIISGSRYNLLLGHNVGNTITTGESNILIGYNLSTPSPTDSFHINIGGLLHGRYSSTVRRFGVDVNAPSAKLHLPASDGASGNGQLKFTPGTLLVGKENGVMEFDGTNLYFTIGTTRHKFVLEAV